MEELEFAEFVFMSTMKFYSGITLAVVVFSLGIIFLSRKPTIGIFASITFFPVLVVLPLRWGVFEDPVKLFLAGLLSGALLFIFSFIRLLNLRERKKILHNVNF